MIVIYTDGSTLKNGAKDAKGGFGVVVCEGEPNSDISAYHVIDCYQERAEGTTNNRMEIEAILWAVKNYGTKPGDFFGPIVYTDSLYCVNSFNTWMYGWKSRGWVRAKNQPVENLDLIKEYDRLVNQEGRTIELRHVKGHAGTLWNELADGLATGRLTKEEVMRDYGQ